MASAAESDVNPMHITAAPKKIVIEIQFGLVFKVRGFREQLQFQVVAYDEFPCRVIDDFERPLRKVFLPLESAHQYAGVEKCQHIYFSFVRRADPEVLAITRRQSGGACRLLLP
jgi:hypothetical protein